MAVPKHIQSDRNLDKFFFPFFLGLRINSLLFPSFFPYLLPKHIQLHRNLEEFPKGVLSPKHIQSQGNLEEFPKGATLSPLSLLPLFTQIGMKVFTFRSWKTCLADKTNHPV